MRLGSAFSDFNYSVARSIKRLTLLALLGLAAQSWASDVDENSDPRQQLRIIALAPHIVELLYSIGAGEQIIGTSDHADYPEAANRIPRVGSYAALQVEKILQMQPDLILAWKTGTPEADLKRLQQYDIPVVYSNMVELGDVADEVEMYGELTGRSDVAAPLARQYRQRLSELRETYQHRSQVTVFYELWSRPLTTVAGKAWPQQQLELCGAKNPFAGLTPDYPQINIERVLVSTPDAIIQPGHNGVPSGDVIDWSRWPSLPAVANQQILHPDSDSLHRMTLRALDGLEQLCEGLEQVRQQKN